MKLSGSVTSPDATGYVLRQKIKKNVAIGRTVPTFTSPTVSRQCHWLKNISQRCYSLPAPKTQRSHSSVELLYGTLKQLLLDMAFRFLLPQLYDSLRVGYPSTSELSFGRDEEARPIENDSLSGCNASQLWHRY